MAMKTFFHQRKSFFRNVLPSQLNCKIWVGSNTFMCLDSVVVQIRSCLSSFYKLFNSFLVYVIILSLYSSLLNQRFSDIFRGYKMGTLVKNRLMLFGGGINSRQCNPPSYWDPSFSDLISEPSYIPILLSNKNELQPYVAPPPKKIQYNKMNKFLLSCQCSVQFLFCIMFCICLFTTILYVVFLFSIFLMKPEKHGINIKYTHQRKLFVYV